MHIIHTNNIETSKELINNTDHIWIIKESMTKDFIKAFNDSHLDEHFLEKCKKSSEGINTNK